MEPFETKWIFVARRVVGKPCFCLLTAHYSYGHQPYKNITSFNFIRVGEAHFISIVIEWKAKKNTEFVNWNVEKDHDLKWLFVYEDTLCVWRKGSVEIIVYARGEMQTFADYTT